ncbi:MAG: hypothetical protein QMC74_01045 [Myxococcota bacterium]
MARMKPEQASSPNRRQLRFEFGGVLQGPKSIPVVSAVTLVVLLALLGGCQSEGPPMASRVVQYFPAPIVDAFWTSDQQARAWHEAGDPLRAASLYRNPIWKGIAFEDAGDLTQAAATFSRVDTAEGAFLYGNALARSQKLAAAAHAYSQALVLMPDLQEAKFNLGWVQGLIALGENEYEDFGGTGGQLEADEFVFDDRAANAIGEMTIDEARVQGLSPEAIREMWMRRVQTTPGDFLRLKFAYQAQGDLEGIRSETSP